MKAILTNLEALKTCNTCKNPQPISNFTSSPTNRDGKKGKCKRCYSTPNSFKGVNSYRAKADYYIKLIYDYISIAGVCVGDKLPRQKVMAKEIGISEAVLREHLAILQYNGHINSVWGSGRTLVSWPTHLTS